MGALAGLSGLSGISFCNAGSGGGGGGDPTVPVLTLDFIDYRFGLSWTTVPGATSYDVYVDGVLRFPTQTSPAGFDIGNWEYAVFTVVANTGGGPSDPSNEVSGVSLQTNREYPSGSGNIVIDDLPYIYGSFLPYAAISGAGASGDALGGGGGGGASHAYNIPFTAHASYPYVIGQPVDGGDGGDSSISFDTPLLAGGGKTFTHGGSGGTGDFAGGDGFPLGGGGSGATPFIAGNPGDSTNGGAGIGDADIIGGAGGAPGFPGDLVGGGGGTGTSGVGGQAGGMTFHWYQTVQGSGLVMWDKFGGLGNLNTRTELLGKSWVYAGDLTAHVVLSDGSGTLSADPVGVGVAVLNAPLALSGDYYIQLDTLGSTGLGVVFDYVDISNHRRVINDGTDWRYQRIVAGVVTVNTVLEAASDVTAYVSIGPTLFRFSLNSFSDCIQFSPASDTIGLCYTTGAISGIFDAIKVAVTPTIAINSSNIDADTTKYVFNFAENIYVGGLPIWKDSNGNSPISYEDIGGGVLRIQYSAPVVTPILVPPGDTNIFDSATFTKNPASGAYS